VADLLPHFQVLRCDTRGHGASEAPTNEYSIEMLWREVLGLADALGISQFAFCGISLGGMIGPMAGNPRPRAADETSAGEYASEGPSAGGLGRATSRGTRKGSGGDGRGCNGAFL
jgi:3-oxoadipate enol-lactonase